MVPLNRSFGALLLAAVLAATLAGCGGAPSPTAQAIPASPTPSLEAYPPPFTPTPASFVEEGYPVPSEAPPILQLPDSLELPTPSPEAGVVTGQLLTPGPGGEPYIGALFLAHTIETEQAGYPPIVAFSDSTDPRALQDKTGRFLFAEVPPGTYALVIWSPVASTVVVDPETDDYLLFEVEAGKVKDLGVVPIP